MRGQLGVRGNERRKAYVKASRSNICTYQCALLSITEFEKRIRPLLLLLLAVQIQDWKIDVIEEFRVVFDAITAGEEDDDFLLKVALQEGEEQEEAFVRVTDHVSLFQTFDCAMLLLVVDVDIEWAWSERYPCQIFDFGGLCGGEEHCLSLVFGEDLDDLAHFVFEADFEDSVCFVDD